MFVFSKSDELEIVGYVDSDFTRSLDDMKSTPWVYVYIGWWNDFMEKS